MKEVSNNSEINFHQVDCYFFKVIKQTQVRTVENLSCKRERDGTQYWLSDGKKYVEWGKWSNWSPEKEEKNIEMAEKNRKFILLNLAHEKRYFICGLSSQMSQVFKNNRGTQR